LSLLHQKLEELVDLLEFLGGGTEILLNIGSLEHIFQVNPLLLYANPLFNGIGESEQALAELFSRVTHDLDETVT